ncbi:preprotein translocase subunit YajC [Sphingobium boeckii]|uniref:Sec translocon accessory complex subunit YajC n=1 Tax=Sphingobium boeckii TaxID=1082345 RepID=A0A7W9AIR6_9SPHN|nr:preprotein translocase subunit YajC [Sphingobium boeckii]MBB5686206.1 preprotein translocase subunit YajC [Sphingobium boeckii]
MFITPAYAQTAGAASGGSTAFLVQMAPLVLIFIIFWFLLIRPQQKRMKDHAAKVAAVQKNDQVVTSGGIIGKVTKVDNDIAEVEIATGVKVKVVKSTLSDVTPAGGSRPAND